MISSESFWQLARFGVTGLALTALVSVLYLGALAVMPIPPALALTLATVLASIVGFFAHSRISFRGHGSRDRPMVRLTRFLITNGIGYLLNLAFVVVLVDLAHLPEWTPIIAFCSVTPLASFMLNRVWVFG